MGLFAFGHVSSLTFLLLLPLFPFLLLLPLFFHEADSIQSRAVLDFSAFSPQVGSSVSSNSNSANSSSSSSAASTTTSTAASNKYPYSSPYSAAALQNSQAIFHRYIYTVHYFRGYVDVKYFSLRQSNFWPLPEFEAKSYSGGARYIRRGEWICESR